MFWGSNPATLEQHLNSSEDCCVRISGGRGNLFRSCSQTIFFEAHKLDPSDGSESASLVFRENRWQLLFHQEIHPLTTWLAGTVRRRRAPFVDLIDRETREFSCAGVPRNR